MTWYLPTYKKIQVIKFFVFIYIYFFVCFYCPVSICFYLMLIFLLFYFCFCPHSYFCPHCPISVLTVLFLSLLSYFCFYCPISVITALFLSLLSYFCPHCPISVLTALFLSLLSYLCSISVLTVLFLCSLPYFCLYCPISICYCPHMKRREETEVRWMSEPLHQETLVMFIKKNRDIFKSRWNVFKAKWELFWCWLKYIRFGCNETLKDDMFGMKTHILNQNEIVEAKISCINVSCQTERYILRQDILKKKNMKEKKKTKWKTNKKDNLGKNSIISIFFQNKTIDFETMYLRRKK